MKTLEYGPVATNFWKYTKEVNGCFVWQACTDSNGYGVLSMPKHMFEDNQKRVIRAHQYAYRAFNAIDMDVSSGLDIDHLCRNTSCVNPFHLEEVPHRVNALRGVGQCAINAKKTHCVRGHAFSGDNIRITKSGHRRCVECVKFHNKRLAERRKAARRKAAM